MRTRTLFSHKVQRLVQSHIRPRPRVPLRLGPVFGAGTARQRYNLHVRESSAEECWVKHLRTSRERAQTIALVRWSLTVDTVMVASYVNTLLLVFLLLPLIDDSKGPRNVERARSHSFNFGGL